MLDGGAGSDVLIGNAGSDTFVFHPNPGHDTITDFDPSPNGGDILRFDHTMFASVQDIFAHSAQSGANVVITIDAQDDVTLLNVNLASLASYDFFIA
jgi:Ca2+-binding RTX toxin-like protein